MHKLAHCLKVATAKRIGRSQCACIIGHNMARTTEYRVAYAGVAEFLATCGFGDLAEATQGGLT